LVLIRENGIINLIERAGYYYHLHIANRVLRPLILQIYLENKTWNDIETFTEKVELYRHSGFRLDDLYRQIAACARLISAIRNGIPSIKAKVRANSSSSERIYMEMTVNNLPNNVKAFADQLYAIYMLLIDIDKKNAGSKALVYTQIQGMSDVSYILTG